MIRSLVRRLPDAVKKLMIPAVGPVVDAVSPLLDESLFDWLNGTETRRRVDVAQFRTASPVRTFAKPYMPAGTRIVRRAFAALRAAAADFARFTFVDFGAGKGKVCILAARLGFRQIIGVEFEAALIDIANRNLDRALSVEQRAATAIHYMDALEFSFPETDIVAFFFNPFTASVMAPVVAKLQRHAEAGFAVYVIYVWALCIDQFAEGWETLWGDARGNVRTFLLRCPPSGRRP
jgi:SAM-dependent methyltransferase